MTRLVVFALPVLLFAVQTEAQEPVRVAVMEFASKGGIEQNQMDALSDMLANEIRQLGRYRVIGKSDIRAALKIEEDKLLLGCSNESCIAEIGGALGVRWVVVGNISLFGKTYLINLKMMDVEKVRVAASISKTVKGEQDQLIELLPVAVRELFLKSRSKLWSKGAKPPAISRPGPTGAGEWSSNPGKPPAPVVRPTPEPKPIPSPAVAEPTPPKPKPDSAAPDGKEPDPVEPPGAKPKPGLVQPPSAGTTEWQVVQPDKKDDQE